MQELNMEKIYMDHCATTPLHPEVMAVMMKFYGNFFGNPGSVHSFGDTAKKAIEKARRQVAGLLGAEPSEIVFTSGGTEADNMAILGIAAAAPEERRHIVTSAIEHPAVLNACRYLEQRGYKVTYLPVDSQGVINPENVAKAVTDETCLVSIMHGNNEVGVIEALNAISEIVRAKGAFFHTDAVQTVGKIPLDLGDTAIDCLSLSGHKVYGPKGSGALYVRRGTVIKPLSFGGNQEGGLRSGTENVPGIVGLGKACEIALRDMAPQWDHTKTLRDRLEEALTANLSMIFINSAGVDRMPHVLSASIGGIRGDELVRELDREGIAVSAGAACHAGISHVSYVLSAMGIPEEYSIGTVRFSVGRMNTCEEIDRVAETVIRLVGKLRS